MQFSVVPQYENATIPGLSAIVLAALTRNSETSCGNLYFRFRVQGKTIRGESGGQENEKYFYALNMIVMAFTSLLCLLWPLCAASFAQEAITPVPT